MRNICVYAGRFHPWHVGHKFVYDYLVGRFGVSNVYITCTNVTDPVKSPFTFDERKKMMVLTGVPEKQIINVKSQYNALDLEARVSQIKPTETVLFFAISQKDMSDNPRFGSFTKKDGSASYILPEPKDSSTIENMTKHAYLTVVPTKSFTLLGKKVLSATQIREMFSKLMSNEYEEFMTDLFGKYDVSVLNILKARLQKMMENIMKKSNLKQLIRECLDEMSISQGKSTKETVDSEFNIGDRVEFTISGTIKENRYNNNMLTVELDNDSTVNIDPVVNNVKKLEF